MLGPVLFSPAKSLPEYPARFLHPLQGKFDRIPRYTCSNEGTQMTQSNPRNGRRGLLILLVAAVLMVWWSSTNEWGVHDEVVDKLTSAEKNESANDSTGSRILIPVHSDEEGLGAAGELVPIAIQRDDLLTVTLAMSTTTGVPIPGCKVIVKGLTAPKWTIPGESDLVGKFTFQWPKGHALIAKVWPNSSSPENPPVAIEILVPTEESKEFVIEVPAYAGLRADLEVVGQSLPDSVFVTVRRKSEIDEAVLGEGSFASLFRSDSDGLRNTWSGWATLNGDQVIIEQLPPGEYRVHFTSSAGMASLPSKMHEAISLVENAITDLGTVRLKDGGNQASVRIEERDTEMAISEASIKAIPLGALRASEQVFFEAKSDANGLAIIPMLSPDWRLVVSKEGFASLDFYCSMLSSDQVNKLPLGQAAELQVSLAGIYQGLPDPDVAVFQLGRMLAGVALESRSFHFQDIYPRPATVILAAGGKTIEMRQIELLPGDNELLLGEAKGQVIRGIVETVDGPLKTGFVVLIAKDMEANKTNFMQALRKGRFEIPLAEGSTPTVLRVISGGSWQDPDGYFSIPLSSSQVSNGEIRVQLPNGAMRISVPVHSASERSITKIRVKRQPVKVLWGGYPGKMSFEVYPDSKGIAEVTCLPAGEYVLSWAAESGRQETRCNIAEGALSQVVID